MKVLDFKELPPLKLEIIIQRMLVIKYRIQIILAAFFFRNNLFTIICCFHTVNFL